MLLELLLALLLSQHITAADDHQYILSEFDPLQRVDHVPLQIAIIGAGAGGSSAAYHLAKFAQASEADVALNITLFDTNPRIGGRTTTVNVFDNADYPVEVGASIFVKINHILYNASQEFGLQGFDFKLSEDTGSNYELGVWDGDRFVYKSAVAKGQWQEYWDIAKLLWQYGLAPFRTQNLMKSTVGKFLKFYEEPYFPFRSLQNQVMRTGLIDFTKSTGRDVIQKAGISDDFAGDIIQASTRVNYAQNLDQIHGLGAMVCMATDGAMSIEGGNWQIFHEALKRSNAIVNLNTTVADVHRDPNNKYHIFTTANTSSPPFDAIILAAPYQQANITFSPPLQHIPKPIPYVRLYVTLIATPFLPSPQFFNLDPESQSEIPNMILTTTPSTSSSTNTSDFFSINILRIIPPSSASPQRQFVYKIFSPKPVTPRFLGELFNFPGQLPSSFADRPISKLPSEFVAWSHVHTWNSYPYLEPTEDFDPILLDDPTSTGDADDSPSLSPCQIRSDDYHFDPQTTTLSPDSTGNCEARGRSPRGVWYTSGIEPFISTMETSALMGMNVARLIVDELEVEIGVGEGRRNRS